MLYLQRLPNPLLRPWIRSLWYCRAPHVPHSHERVLPSGGMQILINMARTFPTDSIIVGARASFEIIDTADLQDLAGIAVRPGGFATLFHERADLFFEQFVDLEAVWPKTSIAERLAAEPSAEGKLDALDLLLTGLLHPNSRRPELVDQSIYLFREKRYGVAECARSLGVSERRLSQVFREHVGLAPKMWCRIGRFQAAARALHQGSYAPWAELALACGYYDQSHFANDFRAFSGIDPTTYCRHDRPWQNHVAIE